MGSDDLRERVRGVLADHHENATIYSEGVILRGCTCGAEVPSHAAHVADAVLDALGDVLAENERHRRANLVRAVIDRWDEDIDGALTDYINEHGWDAVPWKIAERLAAPSSSEGVGDG